jgi:5'(3')-deoxyribonucleotidase
MKKLIIAVDIDDVLSKTSQAFVEFSNKTWGHNLKPDDYDEDWARIWGTPIGITRKRADYLHKNGMFRDTLHYSEAFPVLERLHDRFTLVVATSRRSLIKEITMEWLDTYYRGIFDGVFFSGIYDGKLGKHEEHLSLTKNDILMEIGADYLIDDQLKHCIAAEEHGIKSILFGNYKWNQGDNLPPHVTRCVDWGAVEDYFAARK